MKNIILLTVFVIISGIDCFSQDIKKQTYYDLLNTHTNEIFEVLEATPEIYNGDYWMYSEEGRILEKGTYTNNTKTDDWVRFNQTGQILHSGLYNNNEFTGFQFTFNDSDNLIEADYYNNSVNVDKDSVFIDEYINSLKQRLYESDFSGDARMKEDFDSFMNSINISDSTKFDSISENFNNLAYQGNYFIVGHTIYIDCLNQLKFLNDSIEEFKTNDIENELLNYINQTAEAVNNLRSSVKIDEVLNNTMLLIDEFRVISKQITRNSILKNKVNQDFDNLKVAYHGLAEEIYQPRLKELNSDYQDYNNEKDLNFKLIIIDKLIPNIEIFNKELTEISTMFSEIKLLKDELESSYRNKYSLIYNEIEIQIENNQDKLKKEANYQNKLFIANRIKEDINVYNIQFLRLDTIEIFINQNYEHLKNNYLQEYPSIYSKEIKSLDASINNYYKLNSIDDKIYTGDDIIKSITFYDKSIIDFKETDKFINEKFPAIETEYKEKFREIYKSEVVVLQKVFKRYKMISGAISKVETGNQIKDKIFELETNLELMSKQNIEIETNFPLIAQQYEAEFSAIYKNDIRIFEKKIELFKKSTNSGTRLLKGEEILIDIRNLKDKFKEIKNQEAEINKKLNQVEGNYQIDFPQIYKSEIKDAKANISSYEDNGRLNNKITLGKIIIDRFDGLLDSYPPLKQENIKITSKLPSLITDYKKYFPQLYKLHIVDLIGVKKQYEGSGYIIEKAMLSGKLVKSIDDLTEKYTKFKNQIDLIIGLHNDFNLYYQNRKPVAKILKKGNSIYKQLRKEYDNEINLDEKMKKGKTIELMLSKLIILANEENSELNSKMKTVKVPADFLSLLGIK